MKYRLYYPGPASGRRPLIVWLHGGGEGASLPDGYYDNETQLRANRGALGFTTPEAQKKQEKGEDKENTPRESKDE